MLNTKYLSNVFIYFFTPYGLQYIFIIGFYYLIQDYFLLLFSYFKDFSFLDFLTKENFKFLIVSLVFFCVLF